MLVYFEGFTDGGRPNALGPEWSTRGVASFLNGRDGSASGAGYVDNNVLTLPITDATTIFGFGLYPGVNALLGGSRNFALHSGGVARLTLTGAAGGVLQLRLGGSSGTVLASSPAGVLQSTVWMHLQIKVVLHATAGSCRILANGVEVINYTGQTSTVTAPCEGIIGPTGSGAFAFDDLYVCDGTDGTATDGAPNNDFLGDLAVKALVPTAAGDSTQWTPSTGANWATVDEIPANATDYVAAPAASGLIDRYQVTDVVAGTQVYGVRERVYASTSDSGAASVQVGIRDDGADSLGAVNALSTTVLYYVNPIRKKRPGGGTWSGAAVNALQSVIKAT